MLSATNLRHNFCFFLKEYSPLGYLLTGSTTVVCVLLICKTKISLVKFKIKTSFQGFFPAITKKTVYPKAEALLTYNRQVNYDGIMEKFLKASNRPILFFKILADLLQ